jgi:hypothetical protein
MGNQSEARLFCVSQ